MEKPIRIFGIISLIFLLTACSGSDSSSTPGQRSDNLQCQGFFSGLQATVTGTRTLDGINPLGDGYLVFSGTITTPLETAPMTYEDFSNLAPYEGFIQSTTVGTFAISVLDAMGVNGATMQIYDGIPTSGPPTLLGELTCVWS